MKSITSDMPPALRALKGALLGVALVCLVACQPRPPSASYFPLEEGRSWTYKVTTEFENQTVDRETLVLRNLGQATLADGAAWHRRSSTGMNYWLRLDESGVYRVASRPDIRDQYDIDEPHRYVLKEPVIVGTQWQASTTAYILHRRQDFPREIRHSHPHISMIYTIAALQQSIDTLAGHFDGCLVVKGQAALRLFADPVVGWKDMPLNTTEWYCPGLGLVKMVREEPANSTFLGGGKKTLELQEWK